MAGAALIVLAILLVCGLLLWLLALAATFLLGKRNGQAVKKMSWSYRHGLAARVSSSRSIQSGKSE